MNEFWYVSDPDWDEAIGPMDRLTLEKLVTDRKLPATALVWNPEQAEWRPARVVALSNHPNQMPVPQGPRNHASVTANVSAAQGNQNRANFGTPPDLPGQNKPASNKGQAGNARSGGQSAKAQRKAQARAEHLARQGRPSNHGVPNLPEPPKPFANVHTNLTPAEAKAAQAFSFIAMRRLTARVIDLFLIMPVITAFLFALGGVAEPGPEAGSPMPDSYTIFWIGMLLAVPAEAIMLAIFGRTPGKALLGLKVRDGGGGNPGLFTALGRQFNILLRGQALGLPVIGLIAVFVAGIQTLTAKIAPWDRKRGLVVEGPPMSAGQFQAALIGFAVTMAFISNGGPRAAFDWFLLRMQ